MVIGDLTVAKWNAADRGGDYSTTNIVLGHDRVIEEPRAFIPPPPPKILNIPKRPVKKVKEQY